MLSKFLDPKNDFAFKKIFGTPKHKDILIHFLNDMIDFKDNAIIQTVSFLKTSQDPDVAYAKQSIVDVLCTDQQGRQYIVEMQVARSDAFVKRAQYYAAKAYVSQMNKGEAYQDLKEIIFLAITDFVMFDHKPEYKSDHVILDKNSHVQDLKDFYYCFLELPKFKKKISELTTIVEKWAYFFKHASNTKEADLQKIIGNDQVIGQAYEALNQFSWKEEDLLGYERETKREMDAQSILKVKLQDATLKGKTEGRAEGRAEGIAEGKAEGIAEGAKQASAQIAQNLLAQGVDSQQVQAATGLSVEEISALKSLIS